MGIRTKFNLLFAAIWVAGMLIFALASGPFVENLTRDELLQISRVMMEGATGARKYTSSEITPLLKAETKGFHPQSVAAYAAKKNFAVLHMTFPDYSYREAALNPTNLDDRAMDWEADIINEFRSRPDKKEFVTTRETPMGPMMYLARPIVSTEACLVCHSTPDKAPKGMLALYGDRNGFGWKVNEIVATQIVSVPMSATRARTNSVRIFFFASFTLMFAALCVAINLLLDVVVLGPVSQMTKSAEAVSLGEVDTPEYVREGNDQVARLSQAFNRMRRSLSEALRLLDKD